MANKEQKAFTSKIKCPHCGNVAPMETLTSHSAIRSYSDGDEEGEHRWEWDEGEIYRLEPISKLLEQHADAGQLHKPEEIGGVVLPTNQQAPLPLEPCKEPFDKEGVPSLVEN